MDAAAQREAAASGAGPIRRGIARKINFSFAGTQNLRISQLLEDGLLEIGAIHTYINWWTAAIELIPPTDGEFRSATPDLPCARHDGRSGGRVSRTQIR